jgi:hypothetical protein
MVRAMTPPPTTPTVAGRAPADRVVAARAADAAVRAALIEPASITATG